MKQLITQENSKMIRRSLTHPPTIQSFLIVSMVDSFGMTRFLSVLGKEAAAIQEKLQ